MKAAIITPIPELTEEYSREFCLLLEHLVAKHEKYAQFYSKMREQGAYLILDNSAHEHKTGTTAENLIRSMVQVRASEVVVPDMLFSCEGTLKTSKEALLAFLQSEEFNASPLRLMLVPQGKDYQDWRTCLQGLLWMYYHLQGDNPDALPYPPVIGLSKDYETWDGGLVQLVGAHLAPLVHRDGIDIHLLGWGRDARVYRELADTFPEIRSTDSAKPFVYANHRMRLPTSDTEEWPQYPLRPERFFTTGLTLFQRAIARHNVQVFKAMVNDS